MCDDQSATIRTALKYLNGSDGFTRDISKGTTLLKALVNDGCVDAAKLIVNYYQNGIINDLSVEEREYYKRVAKSKP